MKYLKLLMALAVMLVSIPTRAYKEESVTVNVNGQNRNVLVYKPNSMAANLPLMVVTHGMNQNPEYQAEGDLFRDIVDSERFVVAYLRSNGSAWDIGGNADANFVRSTIDRMGALYQIDQNRVYWSGFSMGSMLIYHSLAMLEDKIAAFAPTSGMVNEHAWNNLRGQINLIHCHSLSDGVFPIANYNFIGYVTELAQHNGYTKYQKLENYSNESATGTKEVWTDERTGKTIALFYYQEGGHWPTVRNRKEIWDFCKQFTLNGRTSQSSSQSSSTQQTQVNLRYSSLPAGVKPYFGTTPDLKVDGKNLVDPNGRAVTLHGVMDTPSAWFNSGRWSGGIPWADYNDDANIYKCRGYFTKIFEAIANPAKGTYANVFRLHLDPCWLNDNNVRAAGFWEYNGKTYDPHGNEVGGEANIYHFSEAKLRKYLDALYMPIAEDAIGHGLYVVIRPPGVFPGTVVVGDYYNNYLMKVWDIVSQHPTVKKYPGQIFLELGNEPVAIYPRGTTNFGWFDNANTSVLNDFFQPIINKIRDNGYKGILWLPGTGWQANYTSYMWKHPDDKLPDGSYNIGYAVHFYPGWYNTAGNDDNATRTNEQILQQFKAQVPVVDYCPVIITEVDWSPKDGNSGHYDEHGNWVLSNMGTWGTGSTSQNSRFGDQFKYVADRLGNVSWTIEGSDLYVDMEKYLANGTVQPAFLDKMRAAGYPDAYQACSGSCFRWYYEYACGDNIPMPYGYNGNNGGNGGNNNNLAADKEVYLVHNASKLIVGKGPNETAAITNPWFCRTVKIRDCGEGYFNIVYTEDNGTEKFMTLEGPWNTYFRSNPNTDYAKYTIVGNQYGVFQLKCKANGLLVGSDANDLDSPLYSDKRGTDSKYFFFFSDIKFNSRERATAIESTDADAQPSEHFNAAGQRINGGTRGMHIIRKADGTTIKVMK
ncbi:MAG: cellulase family glycosylhydrolase [Bacteroidaceae bacterium]|nr:cellulase family glycosylhydrolase [Bacteroidaceae bacterium]